MTDCDHRPYVYPNGNCSRCHHQRQLGFCECSSLDAPNVDGEIICRECWDVVEMVTR